MDDIESLNQREIGSKDFIVELNGSDANQERQQYLHSSHEVAFKPKCKPPQIRVINNCWSFSSDKCVSQESHPCPLTDQVRERKAAATVHGNSHARGSKPEQICQLLQRD